MKWSCSVYHIESKNRQEGHKMKITQFIVTAFFSLVFLSVSGQTWDIAWNKQFDNQQYSYFKDVIENKNGGYTVLGSVYSPANTSFDLLLVHFNKNGDTLWSKISGTAYADFPQKLIQAPDGGYLVTASSGSESPENFYVIKTDAKGKEQWRKTFNGGLTYTGEDLVLLNDENILLVGAKSNGRENSKRWLVKLDKNGAVVWEKEFNDDFNGCCKSVKQLPGGEIAITGQMAQPGQKVCNIWIARLNKNMEVIWDKQVSSPGMQVWPECLCCSPDSCFMVVGWQGKCMNDINSENPIFDYDLVLLKVNKSGKVLWTKNFDREGSEGGNAVAMRPDGNFVVAGAKVTSFLGKTGPWMMLVDQEGNLVSENLINKHFTRDQAIKVINSSDGGIIVIGPGEQDEDYSFSRGWIMKYTGI